MELINLYNLKLNQVQIFITAAESGNYTRAGEYLHLTQPMVSKTIRYLEEELGILLFVHSHGRLKLTPAGDELYRRWKNIIKEFESSLSAAHTLQEGKKQHLNVGIGSLGLNTVFIEKTNLFMQDYANVDILIEQLSMNQLIDALSTDYLDAVIISRHLQERMSYEQFSWKVIYKTNLAIYLSTKNPLAARKNITFADLKNQEFIAFSDTVDKQHLHLLENLAADAGFIPKISCFVSNEQSFRPNLLLNKGVVLADTCSDLECDSIRKVVLPNLSNDIILVWKKERISKALQSFIEFW